MLDRAFCAGMQLKGEPHVSFGALVALKQLWDEALAPTEVRRQATSKNHEGDVASVLTEFVPLSKLMAEQISGLRGWAKGRARLATSSVHEKGLRKMVV